MPRRKQTICNPLKSQLVFLESPKSGLLHEYGPHPDNANTLSVPTRPLDHGTSISWVSPQFDQAGPITFPGRHQPQQTLMNTTLRNTSCIRKAGKASVCKFPSLSFTRNAIPDQRQIKSRSSRRGSALPMCTKTRVALARSPVPRERSCSKVPSPPDIRTPDTSLQCNQSKQSQRASRAQTFIAQSEACDGSTTPLVKEPDQVLAEDTPEHEYGIRVTWRRRRQLMRYLKDRGKLENSQILVKQ